MTSTDDSIQQSDDSMTTSWLAKARAGDEMAWKRLDRVYRNLVLWWCLKSEVPREDTEDITQEVFIAVQRGLRNYRHESFRGWLWTITKARIKDYWRKCEKHTISRGETSIDELLNYVETESYRNVGDMDQVAKVLFDEIVSMVQSEFNATHWRAFWMRVVEDRNAADVAEELGITRTVVHNATSRIRRRINEEFGAAINVE